MLSAFTRAAACSVQAYQPGVQQAHAGGFQDVKTLLVTNMAGAQRSGAVRNGRVEIDMPVGVWRAIRVTRPAIIIIGQFAPGILAKSET